MAKRPDRQKRQRPQQTVRERAQAPQPAKAKGRVSARIARPAGQTARGLKRVFKPLKPLAKPFHTRPMRAIGRFLSKVLLINYIRNSWKELTQVSWPNRKETVKLTLAVFAFAIVFATIIGLVDYGLDKIFRKILLS